MDETQDRATDAMLAVSRTMTAIVAKTLRDVAEDVSVPQLRVLVLLSSRGAMNLSAVAVQLDVNPSNASRTCDQLVAQGRVTRTVDPQDRRATMLDLTSDGAQFVAELLAARRRLLDAVVGRMGPDDQRLLAQGLEAFLAVEAAAAGETATPPPGRIVAWPM